MKTGSQRLVRCIVGIVLLLGGLGILQMWTQIIPAAIFGKLMLTLLILGGIATFIAAVKEDLDGDQALKKDKYLE